MTLKLVMAFTGIVFALFVLVHMIGNLKAYTGAAHFDDYALAAHPGEPLLPYEGALWIFRVVLLACLLAHVGAAVVLTVRGRRARGAFRRTGMRSLRSFTGRTMLVGGVVLLLFIVFHILDLTVGAAPAASGSFASGQAYDNLVASFDRPRSLCSISWRWPSSAPTWRTDCGRLSTIWVSPGAAPGRSVWRWEVCWRWRSWWGI